MKPIFSISALSILIFSLYCVSLHAQAPNVGIDLPPNPDLCAPSTITFANPPSVTTGNAAGTTYTYVVVTGCTASPDTTVIPHTTPFTPFTYTFLRSSCDPGCATPAPGAFWVIMWASNANGMVSDTQLVRIASNGTLGFDAPLTVNANETVCLFDTSASGYYWNPATQTCSDNTYWQIMPSTFTVVSGTLGNPTTPVSTTPCVKFDQPGSYMVSLLRPAGSCPPDTLKKTITVKPSCDSRANFTWNAQCNTVQFTPTYVDPGATYAWSFSDGGTSNEVSPSHIFFTGVNTQYTVTLTVNPSDCLDITFSATVPITIPTGGMPEASMVSLGVGTVLQENFLNCTASQVNPSFELFVQNSSTNISPNSMYLINWGDGTPSTMPSTFGTISHTYNAMGLFPIILEVKNLNGCVDSARYDFFNGREPGVGIGIPTSANLCAPIEITFTHPLEVADQNPPGTIYIYEVETGCEPLFTDTLPHTNPFTPFVYTFTRGSCEPDCLLPDPLEGQFVVTMTASNACGKQNVSAFPRISKIGDADFEMIEQVCVGDTVCVKNTSDTSYWWNQFSEMCVTDMSKFWTITPSAGYTVLDGSLGMAPFTSGTDNFCVKFTAQGTYSVRLVYDPPAANSCPSDTITKTICVLPQPIANFSIIPPPPPLCAPNNSKITFDNSSNTLTSCRAAKYAWEVDFLGSDCGSEGGYKFVDNTNENSIDAIIQFDSSGRYLIRLIVENDCGVDTVEREVVLGGTPFTTIAEIDNACGSLIVQPTAETTNGCNSVAPILEWTAQGITYPPGTTPPDLTYSTPGTYTIQVRTSGGCGDSITTETFTVYPIPAPPNITVNETPYWCQGSLLSIGVQNPNPAFEYAWTAPCDPPSTTGNPIVITDVPPDCSGLYELMITDPSSDLRCSLVVTRVALVLDAPPLQFEADTVRICQGQSATIRVQNPPTGSSFAWSPPGTGSGAVVTVTPPGVGEYKYTVTITDSNDCTNTATAVVIVNPLPGLAILPPGAACEDVPLTLTATAPAQGVGVWSVTPTGPTFTPNNVNETNFVAGPGLYTVRYTFTDNNSCSNSTIIDICVQRQPNAAFTINTDFGCVPLVVTTQNGSNTLLDICGNTTYQWDVFFDGAECHDDDGMWNFASGNATSVSPSFEFTKSGIYRLVLTVGNGCSTSTSTRTITVGEAPKELEIDFIGNACASLLLEPTGRAKACNAPDLTLTWRLDGVPFPNPPGINVSELGPHTVDLIATNGCGADTISTSFTLHPLPPAPVVTYNGPVCERETLTFTINSTPDPNLRYCWTGPGIPNPPFCTTATTFSIPGATPPDDAGFYTVTIENLTTTCVNSTGILAVVNPAPPIQFAADPVRICSGQSGTLRIVDPQSNFTYTWSPSLYLEPNPPTGPVVTVNTPANSLNYTVSVTNTVTTCTNTDVVEVIVDTLPVVSIVPPGIACVGVTLPLNGSPSSQGTVEWKLAPAILPGIFPTSISPTTFRSDGPIGDFDIRYIFTDDNGCTDSTVTSICVQPQPNAAFTSNTDAGCVPLVVTTQNGSNTLLDICGNTTYQWDVFFDGAECHDDGGMWNFTSGNATSVSPSFEFTKSGIYRLVLTVGNGCSTSTSTRTITVGAAPKAVAIGSIADVCDTLFLEPTGQVLACNVPGLTLSWYLDNYTSPFSNPPGIGVGADGSHTVILVATNACGMDTVDTDFTIHPLPLAPVVTYNGPVCERDALTFTVSSPTGPDLQYCWTRPGLPDTCMANPVFSIPNAKPANNGLYTVRVRNLSTQPVCENSTSILAVVNPAPPIQFAADPVRICSGQSGTLRIVDPPSNFTYTWSPDLYLDPIPPTGPVVTVNTPAGTLITTSLNYTVSVTNTVTTCTNSDVVEVIIDPLPVVSIVPPGMACVGEPEPLTANAPAQGGGMWAVTPAGPQFLPASNQDQTNFRSDAPGVFNITYTFTDNNGCIGSADTDICVQPQPNASFGLSQAFGCLTLTPVLQVPVLQVSTTNFSDTADNCDNNRYEWDVQFLGAECHNGSGMWSFAPGSNAGSVNPVFNFTQSGVYQLELIVRNDCNLDGDRETAIVTVREAPQIRAFVSVPPVVCEPFILDPDAIVLGCNAPVTYFWTFPGSSGIQSSTQIDPPPVPYNVPGDYTIKLVVTNVCGMDKEERTFKVQGLPIIAATVTPDGNCAPVTVSFSNQAVDGVNYQWNLGDGTVVNGSNPVPHIYNLPGTYTITLTATDVFGCTRSEAISTIQVDPTPVAGFELAPAVLCGIPQQLCLKDASVGTTIFNWGVTPDVGPIDMISNPCVEINAAGDYVITLVARNQFGCEDRVQASYTAYARPIADFAVSGDTAGCEDLLIRFVNRSQNTDTWRWEYDGIIDLENWQPEHLFEDPGIYTISLIVGNGSGCTDKLRRTGYVQVFAKPVAKFDFVLMPREWPFTYRFRDKSSTNSVLFGWNFGEGPGVDSEERNPLYRYLTAGARIVTHWVETASGCVDTTSLPLSFDLDGDLFVPNILEPENQDEPEKRIFLPKGYNLSEYHIAVFARTGQLIWESTKLDANGQPAEHWDGSLNGKPLNSGVFVWKVLRARFNDGREWDGMLDEDKVKRRSNFLYLIR